MQSRQRPMDVSLTNRRGMTNVELVITLGLIILLATLSIPAILSARAASRSTQCTSNLRQFGLAMNTFATNDPKTRFCSGAYDYYSDGCPDTWGWVADAVNMGACLPQDMLCPSSELRGSETLNEMVTADNKRNPNKIPPSRLSEGVCANWTAATAGSESRVKEIMQLLEDGYGTNYAASWYLVRSGPRPDAKKVESSFGLLELSGTIGPFTVRMMERTEIAASTIPLLGCGAKSSDATPLSHGLTGYAEAGEQLSKSYTAGPAYWTGSNVEIMKPGTNIRAADPLNLPSESEPGLPGSDGKLWLHDTRGWWSWHGSGSSRHCNILMADGHVKSMRDVTEDGVLNPGFVVPEQSLPFTNDTLELGTENVYSGPFLKKRYPQSQQITLKKQKRQRN